METPSTETVETTPEEATLDSIVNATKGNLSAPVEEKQSAPEEGNPEETPAPEGGQPEGEETSVEAAGKEEPAGDDSNKEAEKGDEEKKSSPIDPAVADLLEEEEAAPEDAETLKKRYEQSSKEAHRLVTEREGMLGALKKANVKLIQTGTDDEGNPTFGLAPTDEYSNADPKIDADALWDELDESIKDALDVDPKEAFKDIAKKIETELLKQRPPVDAKADDQVMTQDKQDEIWDSFVDSKDKSGNPKYPDANSEEVAGMIGRLAQSQAPGMEKFRKMMRSDPDFHRLGLSMLYWGASRILLPQKLAQVNANQAAAEKDKQNQSEPVIPGSTASAPVTAQTQTDKSPEESALDGIVGALKG